MAGHGLPTLLSVNDLRLPADWALPAHAHSDRHELVLVVEGTIETRVAGGVLRAPPGTAKLHRRGEAHAEATVGGPRTRLLFLEFVEAAGDDLAAWPLQAVDRSGRLRATCEWLLELAGRGSLRGTTGAALLHGLIHEYRVCGGDEDPGLARARTWAREALTAAITLADLARIAGMSRFHFARAFHRATGQPPMRWLRQQRVEAARALLLNTTLPLREIAPRVGFPDEFALSRALREVAGTGARAIRAGGRLSRSEDP
jgi:AraC-like DNA-binding protein